MKAHKLYLAIYALLILSVAIVENISDRGGVESFDAIDAESSKSISIDESMKREDTLNV